MAVVAFSAVQLFLVGHVASLYVHQQLGGVDLATLILASVGLVVASRKPRNPLGWILLLVGLAYAAESLGEAYLLHFFRTHSWFLGADLVLWYAGWGWMPALGTLVTFVLLLFPDGRLPSRRWWPLALVSGIVVFGTTAIGAAEAWIGRPDLLTGRASRPTSTVRLLHQLSNDGQVLAGVCMAGVIVAVIYRYRRAAPEERQQLKWLTYGSVGLASVVAATYLSGLFGIPDLTWFLGDAGVLWFAACIVIAMLRYRLYDIDVIINRTLVYGGLTALLGGVYVGAVVGLGALVRSIAGHGNNGLVVAASTLAVAALFSPARGGIQAFIDHRFYRRKYDAARTLESFGARLRDDVDLDELHSHLMGVVEETMQPAQVSLWLRGPGDGRSAHPGVERTRS